ncbi:MAG: assimilatory sulfite reductase (NADPH) hemoprotein subunit [Burkholderiaceae bacterium]|jgi:sulfite reductase (NADPH) hemoprotein beta-component|nr:assimilatory sulfite reductase (NADPH) hemoprotein subunit [Burkholderiaceae bacterium]
MNTQLSELERLKISSRLLRGGIAESLADSVTGAISADDNKLLKFHGSYQQDDRDLREERRRQKLEPAYAFMLRARLPGGVVTPGQWLAFDRIARQYGNNTLRITTRQTFQWHGIRKHDLKPAIAAVDAALATTIAACGDVVRNVVSTPNPVQSQAHALAYQWAARLSAELSPQTRAYRELWLDGAPPAAEHQDEEPLYGPAYLPRKFKIGLAIPPLNDVDVFAQDLGLIAIIEHGDLLGFNVAVGGGMGATHGDATTYPRLASVIGFVTPEQLLATATAAVTVQRDWGDRSDRSHARLKYTLDRRGLAAFQAEVERRLGFTLPPARAYRFDHNGDRYGWIEGADGRWHLTLHIASGRLADAGAHRWLTGLRTLAQVHTGDFRLTCNQNVIVAGVAADARARMESIVAEHGLDGYRTHSGIRRHAVACVALPTCGLAMAESERYLPALLARLEALLHTHGLADAPIALRVSGCPNGCARPYLGEIALIGRGPGRYDLRLGGDLRGQRLNQVYRQNVDEAAILDALTPLFTRYAAERKPDEPFGDFLLRAGVIVAGSRPIPIEATV